MEKERRARLVALLRSGEFKQGRGKLRLKRDGEHRYCCLGVACELYRRETGNGSWNYRTFTPSIGFGNNETLPGAVREYFGFATSVGRFDTNSLADMNDGGATFEQIADVIESEYPGLVA